VADEGNNRIQWISKDGVYLGSFTWVHDNHLISDVTFDPTTDKLIVPRAYSKHGKALQVCLLALKDGLLVSFAEYIIAF